MDQVTWMFLTNILGILFVGVVILVAVGSFGIRFALRPLLETYLQARLRSDELRENASAHRIAVLEAELEMVRATLARVTEAQEFDRQLGAGGGAKLPEGTDR